MDSHSFLLIRRIVHNTLLLVGSLFLISVLILISGSNILPVDTASFLYRFLIMPTFFLFMIDVGLTIYRQTILDKLPPQKTASSGSTLRLFFMILTGVSLFITFLFYVL